MSTSLMPNAKQQYFTANGVPLSGGLLYTYEAGTTTPKVTYSDAAATTPNSNPIVLDSRGEATVFWSGSYKVVLKTSIGTTIYTQDNVTSYDLDVFADLAATTGAALVGFKQSGTGAVDTTVDAELRVHEIHLKDFYTGTLATSADITTALQNAVNSAAARRQAQGGVGVVYIPAGYFYNLTATITVPAFVYIKGAGKVETYLRRIGNYGNTFEFGTANPAANVQCCGISDLAIFHDHGNGTTPSLAPASWVNPVTGAPAHLAIYTPVGCHFENLTLYCLPLQVAVYGGAQSTFRNIDTYGVWDDGNAVMQEGIAGMLVSGDSTITGSIPTWHLIDFCRFGGMTRPSTSVTYFGGNTKTTTKNIGPRNGLVIQMAEQVLVTNSYTGACNSSGVVVSAKSGEILAGVFISNHFFDPCGVKYEDACLKFESRDAGGFADGVTVVGCQFKGQTNGWRAISDWGSTATYGSVKDLIVKGCQASIFVGNPVELSNVRRADIDMTLAAWNAENYYPAGSAEASGIHIGTSSVVVNVSGSLGGGVNGELTFGANNRCQDGVRADDFVNSRVTVTAVDAGLNGKLFVGPPDAVQIVNSDANFTLTVGGSSSQIMHTGTLTAGRAVTLSTTNAKDGDTFTVTRTGGGAFNLTVGGKAVATSQWVQFMYDKPNTTWRQVGFGSL